MAFPENVAQLPPAVPSGQAKPRRFGLYSLFSGCLSWTIFVLFSCLFVSLFYENTVSGGTFLRVLSTIDLLALLGAAGAIVFGHIGILKGPSQRKAAIVGLVLGYLSLPPLAFVGLGCLVFFFSPPHIELIHFVM